MAAAVSSGRGLLPAARLLTKLYLDIDGVLVTARHTQAAPDVAAFVEFVTQHFACYWLTTHCKGDGAPALRYLSSFLVPDTLEKLRQAVLPTTWDTLKTEAIDVAADFYWLDDSPFQSEIAYLRTHGVANRLIIVSLSNADDLARLQQLLQSKLYSKASLTSLAEHFDTQYGLRGTITREEFEAGFKQFRDEALNSNP